MRVVDAAVDYGYNNFRAAGGHFPRRKQVDVGAGHSARYVAEILVMPLLGQARVIESVRRLCVCGLRRTRLHERSCAFAQHHGRDRFGYLHAGGSAECLPRQFGVGVFVEFHHVPSVEAVFGTTFGKLLRVREHGANAHRSYGRCRAVERGGSGAQRRSGFHARALAHLPCQFGLQFHAQHTAFGSGCGGFCRDAWETHCKCQSQHQTSKKSVHLGFD